MWYYGDYCTCTHLCTTVNYCTHLCTTVHTCVHLCTTVHTCVQLYTVQYTLVYTRTCILYKCPNVVARHLWSAHVSVLRGRPVCKSGEPGLASATTAADTTANRSAAASAERQWHMTTDVPAPSHGLHNAIAQPRPCAPRQHRFESGG